MFHLQTITVHKSFPPLCAVNVDRNQYPFSLLSQQNPTSNSTFSTPYPSDFILNSHLHPSCTVKSFPCFAVSRKSDSDSSNEPSSKPKAEYKTRRQQRAAEAPQNEVENPGRSFPPTIPRKPRRGRKSEAVACEDFIRDSLERTFESIRQQNPEAFANKEKVIKERIDDTVDEDGDNNDEDDDNVKDGGGRKNKMVVEEESADWPLDADVGWGIRASEFFDQYPIKNVVGEDGFEIDWEGELDDSWVKEINCLEWESFAFHPSPLIVLVFERYKSASDNWKTLKELEKAAKVYWSAKDRLPPRTVKIDINIETDLAYALKAKECPQILFLRGNKIVYREKEFRTADELVQMIAYFYYNAKTPTCINDAALSPY